MEPTHADVGNDEEEADPDGNWSVDVHLLPVLVLELVEKFTSCSVLFFRNIFIIRAY
jgi:hypothetical protein